MIKFNDTASDKVTLDSIRVGETFTGIIDGWDNKTGPFLKIQGKKENGGMLWHIIRLREPTCVWSQFGYLGTIISHFKYVDLEIKEI